MAIITSVPYSERKFPAVKVEGGETLKRFRVEGVVYAPSLKAAKDSVKDDNCIDAAKITA